MGFFSSLFGGSSNNDDDELGRYSENDRSSPGAQMPERTAEEKQRYKQLKDRQERFDSNRRAHRQEQAKCSEPGCDNEAVHFGPSDRRGRCTTHADDNDGQASNSFWDWFK